MPDSTRRAFLQSGTLAGLGFVAGTRLPGATPARIRARAESVIQIHLGGGLSHIDTFDPKPEAPIEVRGPFAAIPTKIAGERFSDQLPRTAKIADKISVIRAMTHVEADHDRGTHSMLTGFQPSPALTYPSLGAVVSNQLGVRNDLPAYVCVPNADSRFLGTGYLSAANAPFAVGGNPASERFRVQDLTSARGIDAARLESRKSILHDLDAGFPALGEGDALHASEAFYRQAYALIDSPKARAAFDLAAEPNDSKERYGRRGLGMSCLLARRLVQAGSRYVVVNFGGFDHHLQIGANLPGRMNELDQAFAALIGDLDASGLLATTLVLITTEFGRTPRMNGDAGRDHWPRVFSVAIAGAGIKRGYVHGASNATGADPEVDPVRPADLSATIYSLLGIDPEKKLMSPGNRPIDLVRDGRVLTELLA